MQRLDTRVCAVISADEIEAGLDFVALAMGWEEQTRPAPVHRRNSAAGLGRFRNVTSGELAAGLAHFAATEGVDETLYRLSLARHHQQQDILARRRQERNAGRAGIAPARSRDDPSLATIPSKLARSGTNPSPSKLTREAAGEPWWQQQQAPLNQSQQAPPHSLQSREPHDQQPPQQ